MGKKKKDKHMKEIMKNVKKSRRKEKAAQLINDSLKKRDKKIDKFISEETKPGGILYIHFNFLKEIGVVYELVDAFEYDRVLDSIFVIGKPLIPSINTLLKKLDGNANTQLHLTASRVYQSLKTPQNINSRDRLVSMIKSTCDEIGLELNFDDNYMKIIKEQRVYPVGLYFTSKEENSDFIGTQENIVIQYDEGSIIISNYVEKDGKVSLLTNYKSFEENNIRHASFDTRDLLADILIDIKIGRKLETI